MVPRRMNDKGELLTSSLEHLDNILSLVSGSVQIYAIQKDGGIGYIGLITRPSILGDIEYTLRDGNAFYSEAWSEVIYLALSISQYREVLDRDAAFLRMLLDSVTRKLALSRLHPFMHFLRPLSFSWYVLKLLLFQKSNKSTFQKRCWSV